MTKILDFEAPGASERQAREWLIRLDGDAPLTDAEDKALRAWMAAHPSHRDELRRISTFWSRANVLTELAVPLQPRGRDGSSATQRTRRWALAASILVVLSVSGWWWYRLVDGVANGTYGTAIGRQLTIALPDGSSIQINTDSQVQVGYTAGSRKIRLLRGEALFSVAHDRIRPFDVYAAEQMVRAVGTVFAVRLEASQVDVTVTQGVVDVNDISTRSSSTGNATSAAPISSRAPHRLGRLKAGQASTFGSGAADLEVRQLAQPELQRRMAWHEGYLVFSGEPLSEVVEQVNRYSPVTLEIADPKLLSVSVGGRFRIGDLDAVLDVLHANFGIQSTRVDEREIRLEAAPSR